MTAEFRTIKYTVQIDSTDTGKQIGSFKTSLMSLNRSTEVSKDSMEKLANQFTQAGQKATVLVNDIDEVKSAAVASHRQMLKNEKQLKALSREYSHLSQKTGQNADRQEKMNALFRLGENATLTQKKQLLSVVKAHQEHRKAMDKSQGSMRSLRGQAQNFGYQIQDVAVQAQMGTDSLIILGQQGSQIAAGFGATGAMIGAGIAIGAAALGVLLKTMGSTSATAKELKKDFDELTASIVELNKEGGTTDLGKAINADIASESLKKAEKNLKALTGRLDRARALADAPLLVVGVGGRTTEYEKTIELKQKEAAAIRIVEQAIADENENIKAYIAIMSGATDESEKSNKDINDKIRLIAAQIRLYGQSADAIEREKLATSGGNGEALATLKILEDALQAKKDKTKADELAAQKAKDEADQLEALAKRNADTNARELKALQTKTALMGKSRSEQLEYMKQLKMTEFINRNATKEEMIALRVDYNKQISMAKTIELEAKKNKELGEAAKSLAKKTKAEQDAADVLDDIERKRQSKMAVGAKYDPNIKLKLLQEQYMKEREMFADNQTALANIEDHYTNERMKITGSFWEQYAAHSKDALGDMNKLAADSLENFSTGFGDAIGNSIAYAEDLGDAFSNMFKGMLANTISYFAQLALQQTLAAIFKQETDSMAAASYAQSQSFINQASVFEAGLNAFKSTAAIPVVGAGLAPEAATAAIAYTQPLATAANTLNFAGAMDKGGNIPSGSSAIVSEYGDELVGGTMIYNGSQNSLGVTGREDTAKKMSGNTTQTFNVNSYGNASPEAIARAVARTLKKPNKKTDNNVYDSMNRGRKNKGKRFA